VWKSNTPVTANFTVDTVVPIHVVVATGEMSVNAIEGKISFDPSLMSVNRIDKSNSILTSWTVEPTSNNDTGEIVFGGLTSTSSFVGEHGEVMTVYVKGKKSEEVTLRFGSGSVAHAGDGTGNNILSVMNSGLYHFVPKENIPESTIQKGELSQEISSEGEVLGAATGTVIATTITSNTHPNQETWYPIRDAQFSFLVPSSTDMIYISLNKKLVSRGQTKYPASLTQKTMKVDADGVWYFHLTEQTGESDITNHYKVQVDTAPPDEFHIEELAREAKDPRVNLTVVASDTLSGVERFEFKIDGGDVRTWRDSGDHTFSTTITAHGKHTVMGTVYDYAGNHKDANVDLEILPLETPQLGTVTGEVDEGKQLVISGTAIANTTLRLYVEKEGENAIVDTAQVDSSGQFQAVSSSKLLPGRYTISADIVDNRSAFSEKTSSLVLVVKPTLMGVLGRHPMMLVAVGVLIVLFVIAFFVLRRIRRNKIEDEDQYDDRDAAPSVNTPSKVTIHISPNVPTQHPAKISGHIVSLK
jgi:hypothetical protein